MLLRLFVSLSSEVLSCVGYGTAFGMLSCTVRTTCLQRPLWTDLYVIMYGTLAPLYEDHLSTEATVD